MARLEQCLGVFAATVALSCSDTPGDPAPLCGNGQPNENEYCDDGAQNGEYGFCAESCTFRLDCGNGVVESEHETCDDGSLGGTYGYCLADCSAMGPACGDGRLDSEHGETCDEGPNNGMYGGCAADCIGPAPFCGDGNVDEDYDEVCDDGEDNGAYSHCRGDCQTPAFPPPLYPTTVDSNWLSQPPACSANDWLAKYFNLRLRFRGNQTADFPGFVSVGYEAGQSIPAGHRNPLTDCSNDWYLQNAGCPEPEGFGRMSWGDATIWLGEYFALLATEYAVFGHLGVDQSETVGDLHAALMAFNRVDEAAEAAYGVTPSRNGFFVRDDVPPGFERNDDSSYRFPRTDATHPGFGCVKSASACGELEIADGSFVSQDQVMGLIWGLGHVVQLLPNGVVHDGMDLRGEARGMVHRMVNHLRLNSWRVTDPEGNHPPDAWGGNAISFSNRLATAANVLCGDRFGIADYRDELSQSAGEVAFTGLLAIWDLTHGYNRTMAFRIMDITNEWSVDEMAERTAKDAKELFALSHSVLNDLPLGEVISPWRLESLLTTAPCDGPCYGTPGCDYTEGWAGHHRWTGPSSRVFSQHSAVGEFTGIDYLLLHNLYFLHRAAAYRFADRQAPSSGCDSHRGLDAILASGPQEGEAYDPTDPCNAEDSNRSFCGRPFASWLDAAYRQKATIVTAGARWRCSAQAACTLSTADQATTGNDLILGTDGIDTIVGLDGDDCIYGFGGDDVLSGGRGRDEIHGGSGNDTLYGESDGALLGEPDVLWGEEEPDIAYGGPGDDEIYGNDGDDQLFGESGSDYLVGHEGNDLLDAGSGDNRMLGGLGDDTMLGGIGDDLGRGGEGRDKIDGRGGVDWLWGGDGDDFLRGGDLDDRLFGDQGANIRLCGGNGDDELWGNWNGSNTCNGGQGEDTINGCDDGSASDADCNDDAFANW